MRQRRRQFATERRPIPIPMPVSKKPRRYKQRGKLVKYLYWKIAVDCYLWDDRLICMQITHVGRACRCEGPHHDVFFTRINQEAYQWPAIPTTEFKHCAEHSSSLFTVADTYSEKFPIYGITVRWKLGPVFNILLVFSVSCLFLPYFLDESIKNTAMFSAQFSSVQFSDF